MAHIQFDSQKAFLIPDNKREQYFEIVDELVTYCPGAMNLNNRDQSWNANLDPIVIIDFSFFSARNSKQIELEMIKLGAKDITESLI